MLLVEEICVCSGCIEQIARLYRSWVYFGTEHFFNRPEIKQTRRMDFYGIREPVDASNNIEWREVKLEELFNSTDIVVTKISYGALF